tara:strand:+ start:169 stop:351 length:183 start_codon:yes stop_codon:yes gene_type:complete
MKVGDRVKMSPMWKYDEAFGVIKEIKKSGHVVVVWDGINGYWYYTPQQAERLEVINGRED